MFRFRTEETRTQKRVLKMVEAIFRATAFPDPKTEYHYKIEGARYYFRTFQSNVEKRYPHLNLRFEKARSDYDLYAFSGSVEEYNRIFHNPLCQFIQNDLTHAYDLIRNGGKSGRYHTPLAKYELTVLTALNTLREGQETNNGTLPPTLQESIRLLLSSFVLAVLKVEQAHIQMEEQMRLATNNSLEERLHTEIKFVHTYLETPE